MMQKLSADFGRQNHREGEAPAEPKNDREWQIATGEVILEGSAPALPKKFGAQQPHSALSTLRQTLHFTTQHSIWAHQRFALPKFPKAE